MRQYNRYITILSFLISFTFTLVENAEAYIGPGAGFAFISSFFVFVVTFALFFFYLFSLPFRTVLRALFRRKSKTANNSKRAIILGFDGMDPRLTKKFINEGKLPHFKKLKDEGGFSPLSTSFPSISPVAWSSFATGVDPSYHNIFDFITRDPVTYSPMLSSAHVGKPSKNLTLGKYTIPLSKPKIKLLRKSMPFWKVLGERGVFSSVIHVPITFPPEKFNGVLLSGMCTPDLNGSQGTFSFYTTNEAEGKGKTGGACYCVEMKDDIIHTSLHGPENGFVKGNRRLKTPLTIKLDQKQNIAKLTVCGKKLEMTPGSFSPWLKIFFKPGLGMKIRGICRLYLISISPHLELYVSPINIDPEKPALPISHPFVYSDYLAKFIGPYATLGLAEDTWALNEGVIDEDAFLEQAHLCYQEREKMFLKALERTKSGLCICVFDTTDRIQHMFFRCLDKSHPANVGKEIEKYENVIRDSYVQMDTLLGRVLEEADEKTLIIAMSDHGFTSFRRGVNLNTWLLQNGYLTLKRGMKASGDWFENVDWIRTRAYSLGLAGIYINRKHRESDGIVEDGDELQELKLELIEKLTGFIDEETGEMAIREVVDTESSFSGPYLHYAPDLLVGYNRGYRNSWACATGRVTQSVFEDNTKHWSGDHGIDPRLVPGVFFANRKISKNNPDIKDIAPTILEFFGADVPAYMQGTSLITNHEK